MADDPDGLADWAIKIQRQVSELEPLPTPERYQGRRMYGLPSGVHKEQDFHYIYKPSRVSLGPSSADWDSAIELKDASLIHFLRRAKSRKPLQSYIKALEEVVDELRDAYDCLDRRWRDDTQAFLKMMLRDGCFLLEFIRTKFDHQMSSPLPPDRRLVNIGILRIVENHAEMKRYLHDVLLLENQLPMMLLLTLLRVSEGDAAMQELRNMLLKIAMNTFGVRNTFVSKHDFKNSSHLLDVYRRSLAHHNFKYGKTLWRITKSEDMHNINNIPPATELHKVGMGFTTSDSTSLLDIRLRGKTLKLPKITIDALTKSTFLNLIAFEQLHKNIDKKEITSYMYFMGCLVQSAEDASLLQSRDIISTTLSAKNVAILFNRMSKDICPDRNDPLIPQFIHVLTTVRARYNKIVSNEWQKDLNQIYLRTPWKIISVASASLLLVLTFIQTLFTVLAYLQH